MALVFGLSLLLIQLHPHILLSFLAALFSSAFLPFVQSIPPPPFQGLVLLAIPPPPQLLVPSHFSLSGFPSSLR